MQMMHKIPILGGLLAAAAVAMTASAGQPGRPAAAADGPQLAHMVYFKLKDTSGAARAKLVAACKLYLTGHEGTVYFATGTLAGDLKREVNDQDFDVSLHIVFANKAAQDKYQDHPRHLKFVEENKENWEKVRVFDSYLSPARRRGTGGRVTEPRADSHAGAIAPSRNPSIPALPSSRRRGAVRRAGAHRERRQGRRLGRRVLGQLLEHDLDRPVELRVLARGHGGRVLLDVDVRRHAHVLDHPAVLGEDRQVRAP